jgi:hypothetical protein
VLIEQDKKLPEALVKSFSRDIVLGMSMERDYHNFESYDKKLLFYLQSIVVSSFEGCNLLRFEAS